MNAKEISSVFSVCGQITPEDVKAFADQGFRTIVCNRPDGESPEQPLFAHIEKAAQSAGLHTCYFPVASGGVCDEDVEAFMKVLESLPGPVLAYCRSGMRCTALWALSEGSRRHWQDIVRSAQKAGYDMNPLAERIAARYTPVHKDSARENSMHKE